MYFQGTIPEFTEREDWINLLCFNKKHYRTAWWSSCEDMKDLGVLPQINVHGLIILLFPICTSIRDLWLHYWKWQNLISHFLVYSFSIVTFKTSQKSSLECYRTKTYFTEVLFKEFILSWRMFCLLGVCAVLPMFSSCTMLLVEQRACGTPLIAPPSPVTWQHLKFLTDKYVRKCVLQLSTCLCLLFKEQNYIPFPLKFLLVERECLHFNSVATNFSLLVTTTLSLWMQVGLFFFLSVWVFKTMRNEIMLQCNFLITQV